MWAPYKRRLKRDLDRWHASGWVSDIGRQEILADVASQRGLGLAPALAILAAVLFGFAAISFVAAHWEELPRLARLGLLLAAIWLGYIVAGWLSERDQPAFADAAILFAVAMFGAAIMLIAQMYHIDGNAPDAVLMWWVGALFAGALLRSNPALALAMVLVSVWAFMESMQRNAVYWPFLIGWAVVTAAFVWQRWRPGLHLSALALSLFVISIGYLAGDHQEHAPVAVIGVLTALGAIGVERLRPDLEHAAAPILAYAVAVTYAALFALQFIEDPSRGTLVALAALTLVLLLAVISYGAAMENKGALWVGYIAFSIEILALYWKTVGSLIGTSLFFLIAAILVALLAFMALRLARGGERQGAGA